MSEIETNDFWTERLSAYLDGELANGEKRAFEAHLATCETCTRALEELREVVARSGALEARMPDRDLWPGIEARLAARPGAVTPASRPAVIRPRVSWWSERRFAFSVPQLAAAAVALMLLTGGAVWLTLARGPARNPAVTPGPVAVGPSQAPPSASNANVIGPPAQFVDANYDATIAQLQQVLDQHRRELDPHTVRVIEDNLRIIDRATEEARRALSADPANPYLNDHLVQQMRRKVDLLRQVAVLVGNNRG